MTVKEIEIEVIMINKKIGDGKVVSIKDTGDNWYNYDLELGEAVSQCLETFHKGNRVRIAYTTNKKGYNWADSLGHSDAEEEPPKATESIVRSPEKPQEAPKPLNVGETADITVSLGRTLNKGDFESEKILYGLTLHNIAVGNIEEAKEQAAGVVRLWVDHEESRHR